MTLFKHVLSAQLRNNYLSSWRLKTHKSFVTNVFDTHINVTLETVALATRLLLPRESWKHDDYNYRRPDYTSLFDNFASNESTDKIASLTNMFSCRHHVGSNLDRLHA